MTVKILDENGNEVPQGIPLAGSSWAMPSRSRVTPAAAVASRSSTAYLSSSDVGYFDERGLLYERPRRRMIVWW